MRQSCLCLIIKEEINNISELLLAMKKKGFGEGWWNGTGGKYDPSKGDKSILDSAHRETHEEIGIKIKNPQKVAVIDFYFLEPPKGKKFDQQVHVYLVREWQGEPEESEEMQPQWFKKEEIPFTEMWDADQHWLPHVLEGKKLKAKFSFDKNNKVADKTINFVGKLE